MLNEVRKIDKKDVLHETTRKIIVGYAAFD